MCKDVGRKISREGGTEKTRPKNSTIKLSSTLSIHEWKYRGTTAPQPPSADALGNVHRLLQIYNQSLRVTRCQFAWLLFQFAHLNRLTIIFFQCHMALNPVRIFNHLHRVQEIEWVVEFRSIFIDIFIVQSF